MSGLRHALVVLLLLLAPALAGAQGAVLELREVIPQPPGPQFPSVADGHVSGVDPDHDSYAAEYTWTAPPARIDGAFGVTLTVTAISRPALVRPGTVLKARGFAVSPDPAEIFVEARDGATATDSVTVTLTPADWVTPGTVAELDIGAAFGAFVTYRYVAVEPGAGEGTGAGEGDGEGEGGGDDGAEDEPVLDARIECPSDTIVISALPSLSCEVVISGWSYSANPVIVLLPGVVDGWGNQANGLQSVAQGATAAQDPTTWTRPEYRWWLPVFACPSQDTTGANCEAFVTSPGLVDMPVIVRQKGQQDVVLTLVLNAVARGGGSGAGLAGATIRLGSRAAPGLFLNVEGGFPQASPVRADWLSALWTLAPVEGEGFVRLQSAWDPALFLHAETGEAVEAGAIGEAWWSAMWVVEPVPGTLYLRLCNRWREGLCLAAGPEGLALARVAPDDPAGHWWAME